MSKEQSGTTGNAKNTGNRAGTQYISRFRTTRGDQTPYPGDYRYQNRGHRNRGIRHQQIRPYQILNKTKISLQKLLQKSFIREFSPTSSLFIMNNSVFIHSKAGNRLDAVCILDLLPNFLWRRTVAVRTNLLFRLLCFHPSLVARNGRHTRSGRWQAMRGCVFVGDGDKSPGSEPSWLQTFELSGTSQIDSRGEDLNCLFVEFDPVGRRHKEPGPDLGYSCAAGMWWWFYTSGDNHLLLPATTTKAGLAGQYEDYKWNEEEGRQQGRQKLQQGNSKSNFNNKPKIKIGIITTLQQVLFNSKQHPQINNGHKCTKLTIWIFKNLITVDVL